MVLGGMTVYYLSRNLRKMKGEESDLAVENAPAADGEVVDQELEKVLVYIERGLDWLIATAKKVGDWAKTKLSRGKIKDDSSKPKKES